MIKYRKTLEHVMSSDQGIADTVEQKIQSAQADESKSISKSIKKIIEEDSGVIVQ